MTAFSLGLGALRLTRHGGVTRAKSSCSLGLGRRGVRWRDAVSSVLILASACTSGVGKPSVSKSIVTSLQVAASAHEPDVLHRWPLPVAAPARSSVQPGCGAVLPIGYNIARGYPSRGTRFHPQEIGLFFQAVLKSRIEPSAKRCVLRSTGKAVLRRAVQTGNALVFPYGFPVKYDRVGTLRGPWVSGLAQGTLMGSFQSIGRLTRDKSFERGAKGIFESFFRRTSDAFVQDIGDAQWIQEYPTATPSFVLNGHIFAILAVRSFGDTVGDGRGAELFRRGALAVERLLPLFDIPLPGGRHASSYDLTRRHDGAPLRAIGPLKIGDAQIVDAAGNRLSPITLTQHPNTPRYPISVLAIPRVFLRITYTGRGTLEAKDGNAWTTLSDLEEAIDEKSVTIEVPQRLQGRALSGKYHQIHVDLLRRLQRATGNPMFANWAALWSRT